MLPRESLVAGTDMMMSSNNSWESFTLKDVQKDPALQQAMATSWHHVLYTVANSAAMNGINNASSIQRVYTWWEITSFVIFGFNVLLSILLLIRIMIPGKGGKKCEQ